MVRHRSVAALIALAASAFGAPAAAAPQDPCAAACAALIREGSSLQAQGQYGAALDKLEAAQRAAPDAAMPLGAQAYVLVAAAGANADPARAEALRERARAQAEAALKLAPDNPLALDALRQLDAGAPSPLHVPNAAAQRALAAAEVAFSQGRYDVALAHYQEAAGLDPLASAPWVGAGDSWFMRRDWAKSEALFRRALDVEPRNAQAWRFLADALLQQGQRDAAEGALASAIGADPAQQPAWLKLAQLRQADGKPLAPLQLRRGARVAAGADGKPQIQLDTGLQAQGGPADNALRLALALFEAKARGADPRHRPAPYDIELSAWRGALQSIAEAQANGGAALSDPALLRMQAFERDGALDAAILLLLYRETYRPALDAWLQAHPDGVRRFIDRYGVRP